MSITDQHLALSGVRQPRVVRADDYAAAAAFYRDRLGLAERSAYEGEGGAHVSPHIRIARLDAPAGVQLTLFEELPDRARHIGESFSRSTTETLPDC